LAVAFDSEFASVSKLPVQTIKYISAIIVAVSIVLSIKVMGIILVLSLFTIPASAANLFAKDLKKMMYLSVVLSLIGSISGLLIAYFLDLPSGATIIFTLTVLYAFLRIIKALKS
jgi:zinc transport system permease protein